MFERFSSDARRVLALAGEESRRLGHGQIGTEHLVLGILADDNSLAARALVSSGATLDACRTKVAEAVGETTRGTDAGALPLTDRAKRALERASRLSLRRRDAHVETEHVLLSVLDVEGRAGQVLRGLSVDLVGLREAVDRPVEEPSSLAGIQAAAIERTRPSCAGCGALLETTIGHRVMTSPGDPGDPQDFLIAYCSACGRAIGASPV